MLPTDHLSFLLLLYAAYRKSYFPQCLVLFLQKEFLFLLTTVRCLVLSWWFMCFYVFSCVFVVFIFQTEMCMLFVCVCSSFILEAFDFVYWWKAEWFSFLCWLNFYNVEKLARYVELSKKTFTFCCSFCSFYQSQSLLELISLIILI